MELCFDLYDNDENGKIGIIDVYESFMSMKDTHIRLWRDLQIMT